MITYSYLKDFYFDWIKDFLYNNNNFIRLSNYELLKSKNQEDDKNTNKLFYFFYIISKYAHIHKISTQMLKDDISNKFEDTYMCFDSSIVFKYKNILVNVAVLELGGASDMIIRTIDDSNKINEKDIIDINDFCMWFNDYKSGLINCLNCCNLDIVSVDYKVSGIDYICKIYNQPSYKEKSIFNSKENNIVHPCPLCRINNNSKFKEKY